MLEAEPASPSADRIGDIVVISGKHKVLGTAAAKHDEPLRSHGGLTEQRVPMLANRKIKLPEGRQLRNFDVFAVAAEWGVRALYAREEPGDGVRRPHNDRDHRE